MERIIQGFEKRLQHRRAHPTVKSAEYLYECMKNYYERVYHAKEEQRPLACSGIFPPLELFYAMDITPFILENYSVVVLSQGVGQEYFDLAEGYGVSSELCSIHRAAIGMAVAGAVPAPDFLVSTGHTCDASVKTFEILRNFYQCPAFLLDSPYESGDEAVTYYKGEIQSLIQFLEEQTHRKLDYGRLEEHVSLSKMAYDYMFQINELRKAVPSPLSGRDALRDRGILLNSAGLPEAVKYLEARYREIKEQVDRREGAGHEERHRIIWYGGIPSFDLTLTDWLEQEYQATIVMNMANYLTGGPGDTSDPIDYLARKAFWSGMRTYGDAAQGGGGGRAGQNVPGLSGRWGDLFRQLGL